MSEPPFDLAKAHRWFAVELNNRAWELIEATERSAAEVDEMLDAAHGAAVHWRAVGTAVNELRGECLLATAYASAGLGEVAVRHAERSLELSVQVGDEQTDFDRATVQGAAANAYAAACDRARAESHYRKLAELAAQLPDADDRQLLARLYPPPSVQYYER